jgi:hypothetical protein
LRINLGVVEDKRFESRLQRDPAGGFKSRLQRDPAGEFSKRLERALD